ITGKGLTMLYTLKAYRSGSYENYSQAVKNGGDYVISSSLLNQAQIAKAFISASNTAYALGDKELVFVVEDYTKRVWLINWRLGQELVIDNNGELLKVRLSTYYPYTQEFETENGEVPGTESIVKFELLEIEL